MTAGLGRDHRRPYDRSSLRSAPRNFDVRPATHDAAGDHLGDISGGRGDCR
jgi:hypothetical protein